VNGPVKFPLSYIGPDNVLGGQIGCKALTEAIGGKGKVYIQNVKPGISTTDQREEGCKEALQAYSGIELVGVDYNDDDGYTLGLLAVIADEIMKRMYAASMPRRVWPLARPQKSKGLPQKWGQPLFGCGILYSGQAFAHFAHPCYTGAPSKPRWMLAGLVAPGSR
jgi:hypothetical protein